MLYKFPLINTLIYDKIIIEYYEKRQGETMLEKIYLEITNVCNLDCSFCHKTTRAKKLMTEEEAKAWVDAVLGITA